MQNNAQYNYMGMFWLVVALAVMLFIFQFVRWDSNVNNAGETQFISLTDTPPTYNGHSGNCAVVAPTEDRLVFGDDCDGIQAAFSTTWYTTFSGAPGAGFPPTPQNVI